GAYEVLKKRGFKIPDDVAVIGYSNSPISGLISPSLTTVDQPSYELGRQAAKLLIEEIESGVKKNKIKKLPVKLVKRESA
ncbi:MAG: LacI family transcriptional regulator, partial [Ignavibacteria bacterium]